MKKLLSVLLIIALALSLSISTIAADAEYKVSSKPDNIVIDGTVNADEWGEPVFSTTPDETLAKQPQGWDYWSFTPAPAGQRAEFYITNDSDYIYVAGKLIGAEKNLDCPSQDVIWQYPHLVVTFGTYDEYIVCPQIEYQGAYYELYTCYTIGMIAGEPATVCTSQGMTTVDLDEGDYNMSYEDATRSYHYEMRIPMASTSLDIWKSDKICLGLDFTDAPNGDQPGNRYLISKAGERGLAWFGPNNFYFQTTNPLIIQLNDLESMRGERFYPEKLVIREAIPPTEPDYYKNYELMTITAACAAAAALCAAAAAVVVLVKKSK